MSCAEQLLLRSWFFVAVAPLWTPTALKKHMKKQTRQQTSAAKED